MQFTVSEHDRAKIAEWLTTVVYPPIIEEQLKDSRISAMLPRDENGRVKRPYLGAIGGGLSYEFTPTGIGTIFKVRFLDQELDLTDYESW